MPPARRNPTVAVLVPVLDRPHYVKPFLTAIRQSTPGQRTVFIVDPADDAEIAAIDKAGGERMTVPGGYAKKINAAVEATTEPYLLFAADDVRPHPGWFEIARAAGGEVVGLNDLIKRPHRPDHATHFLLTREAASLPCLDGGNGPLCEMYGHWKIDDELIATATKRGHYRYAKRAIVEHINHPIMGGPDDATYVKGRSTARRDSRLFHHRTCLWM